jgi:hypothetical protein
MIDSIGAAAKFSLSTLSQSPARPAAEAGEGQDLVLLP